MVLYAAPRNQCIGLGGVVAPLGLSNETVELEELSKIVQLNALPSFIAR